MKKGLLSMLSILFLFSFVLVVVILLAVFLNINILWIFLVLWGIGLIWAVVVAFSKRRRADVKLRWIMFLVFVPVIGLFSYIFFGREYHLSVNKNYQYLPFKDQSIEQINEYNDQSIAVLQEHVPEFINTFKLATLIQEDLIYRDSQVELLNNPSLAWIKIFQDLDQAQNYILINYYIVETGELYANLKEMLIKKAKQGVKVYFIHDFVGSFTKLSNKEEKALKNAGISLCSYMPMILPFLNWKSNYRDHRKDISIDGKVGYFGGSNISDEYINKSIKFGFWNDEQVRVTGSAVQGIEKIFASDWKFITKDDLTTIEPTIGTMYPLQLETKTPLVQIVASGPNHKTYAHFEILLKLIAQAKHRIWLSTPYFVPPTELLEALRVAALSGLDVRLVLPGLTDKKMLLDISERYAERLFKAGVKIYSMNGTFNHTKAYLIDEEISFIGSTNLDYRAFFADQQTMGLIYDKNFNEALTNRFEREFKVAKLHTTSLVKDKSWFKRFCTVLLSWASPLL